MRLFPRARSRRRPLSSAVERLTFKSVPHGNQVVAGSIPVVGAILFFLFSFAYLL